MRRDRQAIRREVVISAETFLSERLDVEQESAMSCMKCILTSKTNAAFIENDVAVSSFSWRYWHICWTDAWVVVANTRCTWKCATGWKWHWCDAFKHTSKTSQCHAICKNGPEDIGSNCNAFAAQHASLNNGIASQHDCSRQAILYGRGNTLACSTQWREHFKIRSPTSSGWVLKKKDRRYRQPTDSYRNRELLLIFSHWGSFWYRGCERNEACKDNQHFCYSQLGESEKHEAAIKTAVLRRPTFLVMHFFRLVCLL